MAYTTINKSTDYFNTKLWTGTGAENAITGVGFQPDWVWIKNRDASEHHKLYDAVRGANKVIYSNLTNAEATVTQDVKSFDSDGFTLGTESAVNASGQDIVGWNWKAGGSGSSNEDGTVNTTSTSVNTTAGFSISKLDTGTPGNLSFGHGLGVAPKVVFIKTTSGGGNWIIGHDDIGWGKYLHLNLADAEASSTTVWQNTAPTSSVVTTNHTFIYGTGATIVSYCFAPKQGFSAMGSYTGNGNADGVFIYTGFKPAWIMIKNSSRASENWNIIDNKRDGYNGSNENLAPNLNGAESSGNNRWDILSNGFKCRDTNNEVNNSGDTYIYMAFAEASFVNSKGVPCNAR